jgi:CubicO group peptidase (beta-lactamase class C family)
VTTLESPAAVLERARAARVFSACTAEIGNSSGRLWQFAAGTLSFQAGASAVDNDTIFDLASLTKVLSTATLAARHVSRGLLNIDSHVSEHVSLWSTADRAAVTVRDLLEHSSGLPAHRPFFRRIAGRDLYEIAIAAEPLEYEPRRQSTYSDLGFMMLGFIVEDRGRARLPGQFEQWRSAAGLTEPLLFNPPAALRPRIAYTERDAWRGRTLHGEVHDENAFALGGAAGHAGLFGTAGAVGEAARGWKRRLAGNDDAATGITAATARAFVARSAVPGSSRALGWDTMLPTSSCGSRLSRQAIGHTGFTGTSLWIDPARDLYAVLLTNRVHPSRHTDGIQAVRRDFHDAVVSDLER